MSSGFEERNKRICELYAQRHSLRAIGRLYGLSGARIQQILKQADYPRRSAGRPARSNGR